MDYEDFQRDQSELECKLNACQQNLACILVSTSSIDLLEKSERLEHLRLQLIHLNKFEIENLVERSRTIQPFRTRGLKMTSPKNKCKLLVDFGSSPLAAVARQDQEFLVEENLSQRSEWKIRNSIGILLVVPSVCLTLSFADEEALATAASLRNQCQALIDQAQSCLNQCRKERLLFLINEIKCFQLEEDIVSSESKFFFLLGMFVGSIKRFYYYYQVIIIIENIEVVNLLRQYQYIINSVVFR